MQFSDYSGCYVGISGGEVPIVCDLHADGRIVICCIAEGKALPIGYGHYSASGNTITLPKGKARAMFILSMDDVYGEIVAKRSIIFPDSILYFHGELGRSTYSFNVPDDEEDVISEAYAQDVMNSFAMFKFEGRDFGDADVDAALESAKPEEDSEESVEEWEFVPTSKDWARLCDDEGKRIEGAYFDKKGDVCFKEVMPKVFITSDEAAKTGNWGDVSYNIESDTAKEMERVARINRENRARMDGTYDRKKDYSKD